MFRRAKRHLRLQMMAALEPEMLRKISQKKALKAFRVASTEVPAYKQLLKNKNITPSSIQTIEDFEKKVPIIDKQDTFKLYSLDIKKLLVSGDIKDVRAIVSSSGHSGNFSYGLNTAQELEKSTEIIDFMLNYIFDADSKKTLLINGLPMGVKINAPGVTVVDTSVRSDIVLGAINTFARCYDQVILVGENSFVKKVLEEGADTGLDWKRIKMHLILGEEILPENLRSYFANILGVNPDETQCRSLIGSSFGVAEFGLNVFYETKELIKIRRLLARDKAFKEKLIGKDPDNLPALFHYNPLRVFVEELPKNDGCSDIILTHCDEKTSIPLIRYNIKDEGMKISFEGLRSALKDFGYEDYVPRMRMPLVAVWGRDKIITDEGFTFRPEFIKELLYSDRTVTAGITGNFKLSNTKAGLRIEIQTKEGLSQNPDFENRIRELLLSKIFAKNEIIIYPYRDFPHGVELSYEKKFQYI